MIEIHGESGSATTASLAGMTILVTGAGSGIGRATAQVTAAAGARLICTDVTAHDATARAIHEVGGSAEAYDLDIVDAGDWRDVVAAVIRRYGRIDGLVNNAGVVSTGLDTVLDQSEADWDRVLGINLKGQWLGMRAVLPGMISEGSGRVVNVASIAAMIGLPATSSYSTAKGGLLAMTRQAAVEYAKSGVTINAVAPGIIDTPGAKRDLPAEMVDALLAATPMHRLGQAEEIARMIAYLLDPAASFVTGQVMVIDGGWTAQ